VIVARHLGPGVYGRLTVVNAYVVFVVVAADWGFPSSLARELSRPGGDVGVLPTVILGRLGVAVLTYPAAIAGFVLLVDHGGRTVEAAAVMLVALAPACVTSTLSPLLQARLRLHLAAMCELAARAVGFAATVVVVESGQGVVTLLGVQVAVFALNAIFVVALVRREITSGWRFDARAFRRVSRQAAPLGLAMLLNAVYYRVDAVMVTDLRGLGAAGEYGAAYRVMESALALPSILASVVFPLFVRAGSDLQRFRRLVRDSVVAAQVVLLPFAVLGLAAAGPVMRLVGGASFAGGANALRWLMFAGLASALDIVLGLALIAIDRNAQALWLNVAALAVNVATNVVVIPRYGAAGAGAATLVSELAVALVSLLLLEHWTAGDSASLRLVAPVASVGAAVAMFVLARHHMGDWQVAALSFAAYLGGAAVTYRVTWADLVRVTRAPGCSLRRALAVFS
jgi:O-antigen/teichoic acid export membrane protein